MSDESIPRRKFLVGAGLAGTAVASGLAPGEPAAAKTPANVAPAPQAQAQPLLALNETKHAFVVAAVDTFIPADELSPSGGECGCAVYIDRQLASAWGGGAKMYRAGPYFKGKPEQGYQLPLTPAEFMSAGIAAANEWSRKTYGHDFDRLDANKRIEALKAAPGHDHGRFLRRSDLWWQPQQSILADARFSRIARDLRASHR